jgi:GAF domain-containing protein
VAEQSRTDKDTSSLTQLRDAEAREAATRQILDVISQSRGDDQPVFDAIVEQSALLCDAPMAILLLADDNGRTMRMVASFGEALRSLGFQEHWPLDPKYQLVKTILHGQTLQTEDMTQSDLYVSGDPLTVRIVEEEGFRTRLSVPLINDGRGIGCIVLSRRDVAPFPQSDIALVETFAQQAVIAIENARQFQELQVRLEREAATREILEVISQSRDDEEPVFRAILDRAERLCDAYASGLQLVNEAGTHLRLLALHGEDQGSFPTGTEFDLNEPLGMSQAVREGRAVQIEDLKDTDLYRQGHEGRRKMVDVEGVRTHLNVPLMRGTKAFGNITLSRQELRPFTPDQIALVETFAEQAVIAIENARQFRELQTRLQREAATREILQVISQSQDDEIPVLETIVRNAAQLCRARLVGISLVNEARTHARYAAVWGDHNNIFLIGHQFDMNGPHQVAETIREAQVIHTENLADHPLYLARDPIRVKIVEEVGVRTFLTVPLIKDGVAFGCLNLNRNEVDPFDDAEIQLIETFAQQAVIAIESVRQFRALADRTAEVEALNTGLETKVAAQVDQLERLGRLRRFLSPQVADAVITSGDTGLLSSHRAMIATLFCDIRGFTAFCERAEPEETIEVLQTYHKAMGALIAEFGAGVDTRAGDGIMVIFNDPLPCDDPTGDAVRLAFAMQARMAELCAGWRRMGHRLGFGVGISLGYATVGMVGSEGRYDYTASGTAVNLAARLCDHAGDGDILLSPRAYIAVEDQIEATRIGEMDFKGIHAPTEVFRAVAFRTS